MRDDVEQLLRLAAAEQVVRVAADELGEVRRDHRGAVDDGAAGGLGAGALVLREPLRGQAERRLGRRLAGQVLGRGAGRIDREDAVDVNFAFGDHDAGEQHAVAAGPHAQIVADVDRPAR